MSGYTPVFGSVFTGSLCGQYPDTAAWLFLLALADRNGIVDHTPQYIASVTGMPLQDLMGCITRFLDPDPMSRTSENHGRRLELIDPTRSWGWRILNFAAYREKARLMAKNAEATASGADAARKRETRQRDRSRQAGDRPPVSTGVRRSPPETDAAANRPPVSASQTRQDETRQDETSPSGSTETPAPGADRQSWTSEQIEEAFQVIRETYPVGTYRHNVWLIAQRNIERLIAEGRATPFELIEAATGYRDQQLAAGNVGSQFVLGPGKFYEPRDGHWRGPFPKPVTKAEGRQANGASDLASKDYGSSGAI